MLCCVRGVGCSARDETGGLGGVWRVVSKADLWHELLLFNLHHLPVLVLLPQLLKLLHTLGAYPFGGARKVGRRAEGERKGFQRWGCSVLG